MSTPARLVQILTNKGSLPLESPWRDAVQGVPRELFLPDTFEAGGRTFDRSANPERWAWAVYGDLPLITQVNEGVDLGDDAYQRPTSSSSMPTVMLDMLGLLDVHEGHTVFEAGAGTGYNAAWLCHRLGSSRVTTMDVDPGIAKQAEDNLARAGFTPRVLCGNAEEGRPQGAPYDRILATYTVPAIPYAWVAQAPRGRIVAPWGGGLFHYSFAVLDVFDGRAEGRFTGNPAFMHTRSRPGGGGRVRDFLHRADDGVPGRTTVSPLGITDDPDALFYVDLAVPGAWHFVGKAGDGSGEATLWLFSHDKASWATAEYVPGDQADYEVEQYGPRRLWDEVEAAYRQWERYGRPGRDRAGLVVDGAGERVWLDDPGNVIASVPRS
ncbi:methyltransferase domain-containing protein [Streptomyces roseoverticillatus]|uniref:methyltransferase domain-containing protein n=1 Tax=Streptomyces roseoverticillatus TaxID=66429 RepID=UPI001F290A20|nr:methyltransferase domain-containing protein [Streptomyces roseoverticillatus]MCF3107056.1 methyltransferase domain-containing protein [Streptomyces roseoverticillatus]